LPSYSRVFPPQKPPDAETVDLSGRRIEIRRLWLSTELNDYLRWPYVGQVGWVERVVVDKPTGRRRIKHVAIVTSLTPMEAKPSAVLNYLRGHWIIENSVYWVRDVTFNEDRCTAAIRPVAQVLAAIRNVAITLLRRGGYRNLAAATRHCAAHPEEALTLIGAILNDF